MLSNSCKNTNWCNIFTFCKQLVTFISLYIRVWHTCLIILLSKFLEACLKFLIPTFLTCQVRLIIMPNSLGCWEDKCDNVWKFFIVYKLLYTYKTQLIITTYLTLRESWSALVWFQIEILQYWSLQCFENPEVAVANRFFCLATIKFTFLASLLQEDVTLWTALFCPQSWQAVISVWNLIRRCGLWAVGSLGWHIQYVVWSAADPGEFTHLLKVSSLFWAPGRI